MFTWSNQPSANLTRAASAPDQHIWSPWMTTTLKVVGWLECALQLLVCRAAAAAAAILGLPLRTFDKHVRPSLNARRIGRILVFEKGEINQWARDNRSKPGTDQTWEAWAAILSQDLRRTRRDSNPRLLPPEGSALSS